MFVLSQCIYFYYIDDHCQYWLNKADGTLTAPNFGIINDHGNYQNSLILNLNCTWILNADQGFYITLEIENYGVNRNDKIDIHFDNFSNRVYHSSLTTSQSMMDQIFNQYQ